jgi:hypothetical protein
MGMEHYRLDGSSLAVGISSFVAEKQLAKALQNVRTLSKFPSPTVFLPHVIKINFRRRTIAQTQLIPHDFRCSTSNQTANT